MKGPTRLYKKKLKAPYMEHVLLAETAKARRNASLLTLCREVDKI